MNEEANVLLSGMLERYPALNVCSESIVEAFELCVECYEHGGCLLVAGNGGSASDSQHIVGELMKGFLKKRPIPAEIADAIMGVDAERGEYMLTRLQMPLPALALTGQDALTTAFGNDVDASLMFAQQVLGIAKRGDVLICISTSGNSENLVKAAVVAKAIGLRVISLTGATGGKLLEYSDVCIRVPSEFTPDVQEFHLPVYHALCAMLEATYFEI